MPLDHANTLLVHFHADLRAAFQNRGRSTMTLEPAVRRGYQEAVQVLMGTQLSGASLKEAYRYVKRIFFICTGRPWSDRCWHAA